MPQDKNKNPNDSLENLAERLEKELGAKKHFRQYDLRSEKTDEQRSPEILELENNMQKLEKGEDFVLPEVKKIEAPQPAKSDVEIEQLYKQELDKQKDIDRKKLAKREKRLQKKHERQALKLKKKKQKQADKKQQQIAKEKIKQQKKQHKQQQQEYYNKKKLEKQQAKQKNKQERKSQREQELLKLQEQKENKRQQQEKIKKAKKTQQQKLPEQTPDKPKLGWYLKNIKAPMFLLVAVEIGIYIFSLINAISNFLQNIVLPLVIILDIIIIAWLVVQVIKKKQQLKITAIKSVVLLGVLTGLLRAIFVALWISQPWTFINLIIEPVLTGIIALVVGFVVSLFIKASYYNYDLQKI